MSISALKDAFGTSTGLKRAAASLLAAVGLAGLAGCDTDAKVASRNLSEAADAFEINRRIVFYNGITDTYMLTVEGRCSIKVDNADRQLEVTCKTGEKAFKKHFLGLSDNVSYVAEQIEAANVSTYHYRVQFKPQSIVPDIRVDGDSRQLRQAVTPQPH